MKSFLYLLLLLFMNNIYAESITRQEVIIMHKMKIRMALEGENPYIVPIDMSPRTLVKTELLDFSGKQMKKIPEWISNFYKLRKLDLSDCGINIYDTLNKLSKYKIGHNLEVLNVSGGDLSQSWYIFEGSYHSETPTYITNKLWDGVSNLRELNISNTGGTLSRFENISRLKKIIRLDLSKNNFGSPFEGKKFSILQLGRMKSIRELDLSDSGIDLDEVSVNDIPINVEKLFLSGNDGDELDSSFGELFSLPNLVQLKINKNVKIPINLKKKLMDFE